VVDRYGVVTIEISAAAIDQQSVHGGIVDDRRIVDLRERSLNCQRGAIRYRAIGALVIAVEQAIGNEDRAVADQQNGSESVDGVIACNHVAERAIAVFVDAEHHAAAVALYRHPVDEKGPRVIDAQPTGRGTVQDGIVGVHLGAARARSSARPTRAVSTLQSNANAIGVGRELGYPLAREVIYPLDELDFH